MKPLAIMLGCALALPAYAGNDTVTIAHFADPATSASTPLFIFDGVNRTLTGGWTFNGLNLETISGNFQNVRFSMPLSNVNTFGTVSPGRLDFFLPGGAANPLLRIDFDSAQLTPTIFGATEFLATNEVTFSGTLLPLPVKQESFSFALANQVSLGLGGFTASAAFTSSAVPEPSAALVLVAGALGLARRRSARA